MNSENETGACNTGPAHIPGAWRRRTANALCCLILALSCLASCAKAQSQSADATSARPRSSPGLPATAINVARGQDWNCRRIRQTISNLILEMQAAKARAEQEQAQSAQTLARMFARLSGPPGSGNTAFAAFQKARRDSDQLNDLLREKGCAPVPIGVDVPAFAKP